MTDTREDDSGDFLSHDPASPRPVPVDIVAEWEPGTFIENLAAMPDGSWLVTIPSHNRVDRVDLNGHHDVVVELDRHPTGIVTDATGAWVLAGTIAERNWQLVRVERGSQRTVCDLPRLAFGNGMERAGDQLLAADSMLGLILAIDPSRGTSAPWVEHDLLTGPSPDVPMPGANGIAVRNGMVYVTNTGRGLVLRRSLDASTAGLEIAAERLVADDLDIHPSGRIYLATHFLNSVLCLDPDGSRADIAATDQGVFGSTSVSLDPRDPSTAYATTTGGMNGIQDHDSRRAALLLRLHLPAE